MNKKGASKELLLDNFEMGKVKLIKRMSNRLEIKFDGKKAVSKKAVILKKA